jgi:hypothetical protein
MKKELELFLRNANVVSQNYVTLEKNPYRFMRNGVWISKYIVHLNVFISGLAVRGEIENDEYGNVEIKLIYSFYGDYNISREGYDRREKFVRHLKKYGAEYKEEPKINWFN